MNKSLSYDFILNMWVAKRINKIFIDAQVSLSRITQQESEVILNTPQNTQ